jgi:hypothetical protein
LSTEPIASANEASLDGAQLGVVGCGSMSVVWLWLESLLRWRRLLCRDGLLGGGAIDGAGGSVGTLVLEGGRDSVVLRESIAGGFGAMRGVDGVLGVGVLGDED